MKSPGGCSPGELPPIDSERTAGRATSIHARFHQTTVSCLAQSWLLKVKGNSVVGWNVLILAQFMERKPLYLPNAFWT